MGRKPLDPNRISNKDLKLLLRQAQQQGFMIFSTSNNHICLIAPSGERIIMGQSPSDHRALRNCEARMKRHGFERQGAR